MTCALFFHPLVTCEAQEKRHHQCPSSRSSSLHPHHPIHVFTTTFAISIYAGCCSSSWQVEEKLEAQAYSENSRFLPSYNHPSAPLPSTVSSDSNRSYEKFKLMSSFLLSSTLARSRQTEATATIYDSNNNSLTGWTEGGRGGWRRIVGKR